MLTMHPDFSSYILHVYLCVLDEKWLNDFISKSSLINEPTNWWRFNLTECLCLCDECPCRVGTVTPINHLRVVCCTTEGVRCTLAVMVNIVKYDSGSEWNLSQGNYCGHSNLKHDVNKLPTREEDRNDANYSWTRWKKCITTIIMGHFTWYPTIHVPMCLWKSKYHSKTV